jgi:3-oxoacyl-[acyl-carrier-protein] synthase III
MLLWVACVATDGYKLAAGRCSEVGQWHDTKSYYQKACSFDLIVGTKLLSSMIIQSVALRIPSQRLTNEDILQRIHDLNGGIPSHEVAIYCDKIRRLLKIAGAETRYIRNKEGGERGFDLLMDAARSAVKDASLNVQDIDLIIFCGVGRGFLEPANAVFVAKALGVSCDAFDVSEGCMSWVRALHVAQNFFLARAYSTILIVNAEFTVHENGLPNILRVCSDEHIGHTFPALTIGEAVTATVVTASKEVWNFRFRSVPECAPLCTLPLHGYADFCMPDNKIGANGLHQLTAFGPELSRVAIREMVAFVKHTYQDVSHIDFWLPHNSSEAGLNRMAAELNLGEKLCTGVFRDFGNLVSASIPAGVVCASKSERLRRGNRIVFCPVSAGMSFGLVEGNY